MLLTHVFMNKVQFCAQLSSAKDSTAGWTWVSQALESTRALAESDALARLAVPLLILATRADQLVSTPAIRRVAARIPGARLHVYGREAAHEILRELDPVRLDALRRIDAFLDEMAA